MSHYFAAVLIDPGEIDPVEPIWDGAERLVTDAMAPYYEGLDLVEPMRYEATRDDLDRLYDKALLAAERSDPCRPAPDPQDATALMLWYNSSLQRGEDGSIYLETESNPDGRWDWWQIGGRWTGAWSGYNPVEDPRNIEMCPLCDGTGWRNDETAKVYRRDHPDYNCNGCQGKGRSVSWPTNWKKHGGDMVPVATLLERIERGEEILRPYAIVTPGRFQEREAWVYNYITCEGGFKEMPDWDANLRTLFGVYSTWNAVVVDYHN